MVLHRKSPYLSYCIAALFLFVIIGYGLFQARNLLSGPLVSIETPSNGSALQDTLITIAGTAQNIAFISLNGRQIFVDEAGRFSERLLLLPGYNIITVSARDRFGRTTEKTLEIVHP